MADQPKAEAKPEAKPEAKSEAKPEPAKAAAAAGGGPPLPLLIGVVAGALALGGVAGGFLVGPRIIAARAAAGPAPAAENPSAAHGKNDKGKKPTLLKLDNLIVNPAGSQGTRFLMASVAIELPDEAVEQRLRDDEVQVRDAVTSILESQTLEMLTRPGARDSLRHQLEAALKPMVRGARWVRVYLPQMVIQ